jgi:hypothetical protein
MTMTSIASTASTSMSALLQLPACTLPTMNLRTASQFKDGELMPMITSALKLGVQSLREIAKAHSVTYGSLESWVGRDGRPSWTRLKELHGPTVTPIAPKKTTKKRKVVAKTGEKQTKKRKGNTGSDARFAVNLITNSLGLSAKELAEYKKVHGDLRKFVADTKAG